MGDEDTSTNSRRAWLRGIVPKAAEVAAEVAEVAAEMADVAAGHIEELPRRMRPPGAIAEEAFLAACDSCGECVTACKYDAIWTLGDGEIGATTPVMVPARKACHMCDGFPCVVACTRGALDITTAPAARWGTVTIRQDLCFTFRGPECGACARLCPPGAMGALRIRLNKPVIDPELCTGCGVCIAACVTSPSSIELVAAL